MLKTIGSLVIMMAIVMMIAAGCGGNNTNNAPSGGTNNAPGGNNNAPSGNNESVNATAEAVYKQQCISCHAADLAGAVGPNLQKVGARLDAEQISTRIQNGGGGMPAYKGNLTDDEIGALAEWLAAHK
ncbi:c-type cytochrome [Paenibacillus nasutitermitis]|uniref:Cytochrome c domain-containing protein n=1 Tax=Paenibacillus nasutitermitis TaxID=1652958 RepID=A0A916YP81_9BACL|nr:cytochrome c [Paenibacillus nasutitermitis]GGD54109.1 hypothetical protein GCM10010911_09560 [Paenibacillus nasutitermitis]